MEDRLYFRQLLTGRDVAREDPVARQMLNFVYLIGDRETGEAVAVDPAYAPGEVLDLLAADGMRLTGVLATHYHPDHVGGDMMGFSIVGISRLLALADVPIHVHRDEARFVTAVTGVTDALVGHDSGDTVAVGAVEIELVHTPGHTPGSQCFLVDGKLVAGDTLFLEGCGRTDFPGGDAGQMYESLHRLGSLPGDTIVYPGHRYSMPSSGTVEAVKEMNMVYKPSSKEQWLSMFGG